MSPDPPPEAQARYLSERLSPAEWRRVVRWIEAVGWPFGPAGQAAMDALLCRATERHLELLMKCERLLEEYGDAPEPTAPQPVPALEHLRFLFDAQARDLEPFLTALALNGLETTLVEDGAAVVVFVRIEATTDQEFRREVDRVHGLREVTRGLAVTRLRGRRVGSGRRGPGGWYEGR